MKHVMVDIETLGTGFDSVIACIAVVPFNPETGHVGDGAEWRLSVDDSAKLGFKMDCETVAWWGNQSEEARAQLDGEVLVRAQILSVMQWFKAFGAKDQVCVWANSPSFDLVMLREHFNRLDYGYELPWEFWNEWDVRTLLKLAKVRGYDVKKELGYKANHLAIDDARHQAQQVSLVWNKFDIAKMVEAA